MTVTLILLLLLLLLIILMIIMITIMILIIFTIRCPWQGRKGRREWEVHEFNIKISKRVPNARVYLVVHSRPHQTFRTPGVGIWFSGFESWKLAIRQTAS